MVFFAGRPFLHCLLDLAISFLSVGFSLVYYADFICLWTFFRFLFCGRLLVSSGSSPSGVSFLRRFCLPSSAPTLSLSLTRFFWCYSSFLLSTPVGMRFLFPVWMFAPFLPLSLSLVSLPASSKGFSLSVEFVCGLPGVPSSSFTGSSFLLVLILLPCLSLLRLSVSCFFRYFSLGCCLPVVSGPAFPRCYHLSLHGLFSPSLAVLGWSVRLPFRHVPMVSVAHLPLYVTPVRRRFTFLLSRSSAPVESPVPFATGSSLWAESIPS